MPADYGILSQFKGFGGAMKEAKKSALENELAQAQIAKAQREAMYPDVDKLGEQAIFKALQGGQLSPQEEAAAKYVGAKGGGVGFDPTTGNMYEKPNLATQLGINFGGKAPQPAPTIEGGGAPQLAPTVGGGQLPSAPVEQPLPFDYDPNNEWDVQFKKTYDALAGNPKAQQQALQDYSKDKFNMNAEQLKAAGFADRTLLDEPILENPDIVEALANPVKQTIAKVPYGNYVVGPNYQSGEQAQRNFINSILRRESGAVISPEEFKNARLQYFPQPGDTPQTLEQKRINRETAIKGLERSAGPAYKRPPVLSSKAAKSKAEFEAKKGKKQVINWSEL